MTTTLITNGTVVNATGTAEAATVKSKAIARLTLLGALKVKSV